MKCSPIGLVPKREPNSFRLIHHLSFPEGQSINSFINKDLCTVHYASFDEAVALAISAGTGAWLAKADIKSAFRLLPVSPSDYNFFVIFCVFNLRACFILTDVCQWVVAYHARCLRNLAHFLNIRSSFRVNLNW